MNKKVRKAIEYIAFFVYNRICGLLTKVDDKKVVFASEARDNLKGNLKAVYQKIPKEYESIVSVKGDRRESRTIGETLQLWKNLTTAKYIFLDDFYGPLSPMRIRKGQEVVQLWHGAGAFKKFGFSRMNTGDNIKNVHTGYRKYTKVSVTSETIRACYAEAFDIDIEKVKAMGSPRTDIFFSEEDRIEAAKRVYGRYPKLKGKKTVLIAPTYRGRKIEDADYDFAKLNVDLLADILGESYVIAVKWHPALYNNIKRGIVAFNSEKVIDISEYNDINDLLIVSDILVTDYSSVIFDWYLLNKPIVYFTYDLEEYQDKRGLYFDFGEYVYGQVANNFQELTTAIKNEELSTNLRSSFGEKFMSACDGKSTDRVVEWIFGGNS